MARTKATAGFVVYPEPLNRVQDARSSQIKSKTWTQSASVQDSCPLFTKISAEVRLLIYAYVLSVRDGQYFIKLPAAAKQVSDNVQDSISSQQYIFRPPQRRRGYQQGNGLPLLQTCQTVYVEAHRYAILANTHVLNYPPIRALSFPIPKEANTYFSRMPTHLIESVQHLHFFVAGERFRTFYDEAKKRGGYRSETPFAELGLMRNGSSSTERIAGVPSRPVHPKTLTITVRDYDWERVWGECSLENALKLPGVFLRNRKWEAVFGSLRQLIMELEVGVALEEQLEEQVRILMAFEFDVGANRRLGSNQFYDKFYWSRGFTITEEKDRRTRETRLRAAGHDPSEVIALHVPKELVLFIIRWDLVIDKV